MGPQARRNLCIQEIVGGKWREWLESLNEADCLVGDWNAHNQVWDPLNKDDTRGKDMEK